jgi:hypothetical protein
MPFNQVTKMKKLITICSFGKRDITLTTMLLFALITSTTIEADMITPGDFDPGAIPTESFEGLSPGRNIILDGAFFTPSIIEPFTLDSGVQLTKPFPNTNIQAPVIIGDFERGKATFGFKSNGSIESKTDVPFGSAYLLAFGPIEFTFMSDMLRVGAYVTGDSDTITLSAFDASNNLLESASISSVLVNDWGSNFLGIQNTTGIRKIEFSGNYVALDGLTFEVVPVPGAILLGSLGLTFSGWLLHKRKML